MCGGVWWMLEGVVCFFFFFQAEDGIRDVERSRGLGDVYKRQVSTQSTWEQMFAIIAEISEETNTSYYFGYMGIAAALIFANLGSAYGTAKGGVGLACMGMLRPDLIIKSVVPIVMAGILGIYGLIISVILNQKIGNTSGGYTRKMAFSHLAAGLCNGLSSLGAGLAIGVVGDAGVRANAQQEQVFVGMLLVLIFAEALGLYGLIVSIIIGQQFY
eukprot:TRINITY_DN6061_c0_g1_i2.p1 TRINITY_DN6061_c0_g1~~TRINITY_DN6061_c0_g1_i2.p1  ORF type:complete len:215 (-),score=34.58 TRINITY_DN6061_c0_g1_i2:96-740(-)